MASLLWVAAAVIATALGDSRLDQYRVGDRRLSENALLYVQNDDLLSKGSVITKSLSFGSSILCENCDSELLSSILKDANFPITPDETIELMMVHWYMNDDNFKIYHVKEYDHMKLLNHAIMSNQGTVFNDDDLVHKTIERGQLYDQYIDDILDYTKFCVSKDSNISCTQYLSSWYKKYGFSDQNGMQPSNKYATWGEIETTLYYQGYDTFNSLIPYNTYIYADANAATLELEDIVVYMIAEGLHSQNTADKTYCNAGGCRGIFHREILLDLNANPTESYTTQKYHWIFSTPATANGVTTVTTGFSKTETQGCSASISGDGLSMTFSSSESETRSYSQSEAVSDFECDELTDGSNTVGSWHYYQTEPVNIIKYPLTDFSNTWESWYSNQWNPCTVVDGPSLAAASMQTSNAIKWSADPSLVNFKTATFDLKYYVSVKVEQDHIWCDDWTGQPANPCNSDGQQHHCTQYWYAGQGPSHTANAIQAMNNINTTSSIMH